MTTTLLPREQLLRAFVSRNAAFDGLFVTAVTTTRIFCRPTCPARKPKPDNVEFFRSAGDALRAGYRPCRRCHPLNPATFTAASLDALVGAQPDRTPEDGAVATVAAVDTPIGRMIAAATAEHLLLLEFADRRMLRTQLARVRSAMRCSFRVGESATIASLRVQLGEYFAGARLDFDLPLHAPGTDFQREVWGALRRIPAGATRSYAAIARDIGRPTSVRAVARANGDNRIAIVIPCHRVIGADGDLVGYGGGVWRKRRLLEIEGAAAS